MSLNELNAVSPIDGRYRKQVEVFGNYFSEYALIKYRLHVEIEYFIALCRLPLPQLSSFEPKKIEDLRAVHQNFTAEEAQIVKDHEKVTNHDVKAVEYYLKEKFDELGLSEYKEFIHFGLTSQDINNTAIPLSLKEAIHDQFYPQLELVIQAIADLESRWEKIPMLARTHGQPASPTRLGKELGVFRERLIKQKELLTQVPYSAKFGGATGNFNAHTVAFPQTDWVAFGNDFVHQALGLHRSHPTTQIEHYDHLAALFDGLKRINTVLIDFSKDIWQYISVSYFRQKINEKEVGSSAMPHKVNPIDFENAEGNMGLANALFEHLAAKLPVSRLQRDLTDSTVLRNIGVPLAHSLIALKSLKKGIDKLELNQEAIDQDLHENWAVVAEGIQTILRREGYPHPYEALKALTRKNERIDKQVIDQFVETLDVPEKIKEELKSITPFNYTGSH